MPGVGEVRHAVAAHALGQGQLLREVGGLAEDGAAPPHAAVRTATAAATPGRPRAAGPRLPPDLLFIVISLKSQDLVIRAVVQNGR